MQTILIITGFLIALAFGLWKRSTKSGDLKISDQGMREIHRLQHEERD